MWPISHYFGFTSLGHRQNHGENIYWRQNGETIVIWKKDKYTIDFFCNSFIQQQIIIDIQSNIDSVHSNYSLSQIDIFYSIPEPNWLNNIVNYLKLKTFPPFWVFELNIKIWLYTNTFMYAYITYIKILKCKRLQIKVH